MAHISLVVPLTLLGIVVVLVLVFRKALWRLATDRIQPRQLDAPASTQSQLDYLRRLPRSPITCVSFRDALHSQALMMHVESYYRAGIGTVMSGDGLNAAIQSIAMTGNKLELVYSFSDSAKRLYDSGKAVIPFHEASGRRLPWMMDRHGTIIEQAKEAKIARVRLDQATALIVSAAHIIAGLDVVKRLEVSDRKLSTLVAGRASDQDAKLMRLYAEARSALVSPITESSIRHLVELRYDLFELRQVWRGEIQHVLNTASHPHEWQLTDFSTWSRKGREQNSATDLGAVADKVQRLRLALLVEASLAESSGTMEDFLGNTGPEEHQFWIGIRDEMRDRTDAFQKDAAQQQMVVLRDGMEGYASILEAICGDSSATKKDPKASAPPSAMDN